MGVRVAVSVAVALGVEVAAHPTAELLPYRSVTEITPPEPSVPVGHARVLAVLVAVGVGVAVPVGVAVAVTVGVAERVGVAVAVVVDVGRQPHTKPPATV